jgi:hypothetical protein
MMDTMRKRSLVRAMGGGEDRQAYRWRKTKGKIGFHGGKVEIERP